MIEFRFGSSASSQGKDAVIAASMRK